VKTGLGGWLLQWIFAYFAFLIPGEKLIETNSLIAFHHPSPAYPLHILIVPKKKYQTLQDLPSEDLKFESELFNTISELVMKLDLQSRG
jgi:histidine triad (HIT) family protein